MKSALVGHEGKTPNLFFQLDFQLAYFDVPRKFLKYKDQLELDDQDPTWRIISSCIDCKLKINNGRIDKLVIRYFHQFWVS